MLDALSFFLGPSLAWLFSTILHVLPSPCFSFAYRPAVHEVDLCLVLLLESMLTILAISSTPHNDYVLYWPPALARRAQVPTSGATAQSPRSVASTLSLYVHNQGPSGPPNRIVNIECCRPPFSGSRDVDGGLTAPC